MNKKEKKKARSKKLQEDAYCLWKQQNDQIVELRKILFSVKMLAIQVPDPLNPEGEIQYRIPYCIYKQIIEFV